MESEFGSSMARGACRLLFLSLLAGCAALDPQLEARLDAESAQLSPAVEDDAAVVEVATSVVDATWTSADPIEIAPEARLDDYVALALERNRGVRRAIREVESLGYRVVQVGSLEDPVISVMPPTGSMTETAAGMLDAGISVSQKLPFPGKLARRSAAAEQDVRVALARLADLRLRTAVEVAGAYYDYYVADASTEIARESQRLLESMRAVASARYQTGAAMQQDVLRAEAEYYAVAADLVDFVQQRTSAVARLNGLLDRPVAAPLPAPGAVALESVSWRLDDALAAAEAGNPRVAAVREAVKERLIGIELARLEAYPDLELGFAYNFIGPGISPVATGDDNWTVPLGINLPIWRQRLRARVLEANARALASVEEYAEIRSLVAIGIADALVRIDASYRRARILRDQLEPRSRQAVQVSAAAYRVGSVGFAELLDRWRDWLALSLQYEKSLAELERRFADLQMLVGARIPRETEAES